MKSNPYVYPYVPFADLSNKKIRDNFKKEKKINVQELKEIINKIKQPKPEIQGDTVAEKILSIFISEDFLFGPREFIESNKESWLEKLNYFINKNEKIQFTILGFPFKIPVPLKTNRILPDMGEVLALQRLNLIFDLINEIYPQGSKITIFSEGAFAEPVGVSEQDAVDYHEFLVKLNQSLGFNKNIEIIPLGDMGKTVDDFEERYKNKVDELKKLYQEKDEKYLEKYKGTYDSVYRIVTTRSIEENILIDVYNENLDDKNLSEEAKKVRDDIKERLPQALFKYHAYLMVRDDIDFINKTIPNALTLSVSPKPNRLGVIPIEKSLNKLPYHSVTVYYQNQDKYLTEYLIDIKRSDKNYELVYLEEDEEKGNKPFYYIAYE